MSQNRPSPSVFYMVIILLILLIGTACDDTICSTIYSTNLNVGFFDQQTRKPKITKFDSVTAVGTDSIYYKLDSTSVYVLPVNSFADSTIFLFINNGVPDSLLVRYNRTVNLISGDCGVDQIIDQANSPYSTFPEVISKNNTLSITNDNNIEIYY